MMVTQILIMIVVITAMMMITIDTGMAMNAYRYRYIQTICPNQEKNASDKINLYAVMTKEPISFMNKNLDYFAQQINSINARVFT